MSGDAPYRADAESVLDRLSVRRERGLSSAQVERRRQRHGPNRLEAKRRTSAWAVLVNQFESVLIWLLIAAAAALAFGKAVEAVAIIVAVVVAVVVGFFTEIRAVRSMEALRSLGRATATVRRDGERRTVPADELVPGDIVLLSAGDVIPADLRIVQSESLQCDEAALTGESLPVAKTDAALDGERPLAERANMAYKSSAVTRGAAEGIVVAIGGETEIGHISAMVEEAESDQTPLERRLEGLARNLIWVTFGVAIVVAGAGIAAGKDVVLMVETGIALAIAAVPEGLPIVATVALAYGMWRMARRNAIVKRLSAVESLGATNVIFTDKTGTLTENRMTVHGYALAGTDIRLEPDDNGRMAARQEGSAVGLDDNPALRRALEIGVLCTEADPDMNEHDAGDTAAVDPMEAALIDAGRAMGLPRRQLLAERPEERKVSFDPDVKMMATVHRAQHEYFFAVKGAPRAILDRCRTVFRDDEAHVMSDAERDDWVRRNDAMAGEGLRVLGLAFKNSGDPQDESYRDLTLIGLVGLYDPPREGVRAAMKACAGAGIRVVMVTGDQPKTASSIARAVGIGDGEEIDVVWGGDLRDPEDLDDAERRRLAQATVFARVTPGQKLALTRLYQELGGVVAMTGDGVNDAPALKKADVGVAMGQRGTEVAREAADIVLKNDAFATIVVAVGLGRTIFANIRRFIVYLLSGNLGEIVAVSVAAGLNAPLPLLPLQILYINLVNDVLPALALGVSKGDPDVMGWPPRDPGEPILARAHWWAIIGYAGVLATSVLGALWIATAVLGLDRTEAVTVSFLTFGFARLWHVFNMRSTGSSPFANDVVLNPYVWLALAIGTGLLLAAVHVPILADVLAVAPPDPKAWALIIAVSLVPLVLGQIAKAEPVARLLARLG